MAGWKDWIRHWWHEGPGSDAVSCNVPASKSMSPGMGFRSATDTRHNPTSNPLAASCSDFLSMPGQTPFAMFEVYRFLRDNIPDISDAVWTWKRLCQAGFDVEIVDTATNREEQDARRLIAALDVRVNQGDRGMDGLLDIFYESLFTYGAAALELLPGQHRNALKDVVPVDVPGLRFRREQGRNTLYQLQSGKAVRLPANRILYVGLDRDGTNPYGRSMLRSLPTVIKMQQQLQNDMAKAIQNAGWNKMHVKYSGEEPGQGEDEAAYQKRMQENLTLLRDLFSGLRSDQNLVTFDNVSVDVLRGDLASQNFYDNHKAIEEQVITGMHLMPILLGRNYGTTETYGTVQFEIINRQVETVNRSVQRILEQIYNHELALGMGNPRARVHMRSNRTTDVLKSAQARGQEIENVLRLRSEGLIDESGARSLLRLPGTFS